MTSCSRDKATDMTLPPQPAQAAQEPRITARAGPGHHAGGLHRKGAPGGKEPGPSPPPRGQSPHAGVRARQERACMKATAEHSASQTALLNRVTYK